MKISIRIKLAGLGMFTVLGTATYLVTPPQASASPACMDSPWKAKWHSAVSNPAILGNDLSPGYVPSYAEIIPLRNFLPKGVPWLSARFGVAASQVVNRQSIQSGLPQDEGAMIPFFYSEEFLRSARTPKDESLLSFVKDTLSNIETATDADVEVRLTNIRKAIDKAPIPIRLLRAIDGKLSQVFMNRRTRLIFYPSRPRLLALATTHPSDIRGIVVCPTDTLETSKTSACPGVARPSPVARALKRVWASAFDLSPEVARKTLQGWSTPSSASTAAVFIHTVCSASRSPKKPAQ